MSRTVFLARAVRLLDEAAVLACATYVDLIPIRAAIAETLEQSDFTSVQKRIQAVCQQANSIADKGSSNSGDSVADEGSGTAGDSVNARVKVEKSDLAPDAHLSRLSIDELSDPIGPCCHQGTTRASDKGFLPMSVAAFIDLLDWTARQMRSDKRGSTPDSLASVFERLGISDEIWCGLVKDFGRLLYAVAGRPDSVDSHRSRDCQSRYKTKQQTRQLMGVGSHQVGSHQVRSFCLFSIGRCPAPCEMAIHLEPRMEESVSAPCCKL